MLLVCQETYISNDIDEISTTLWFSRSGVMKMIQDLLGNLMNLVPSCVRKTSVPLFSILSSTLCIHRINNNHVPISSKTNDVRNHKYYDIDEE